MSKMGDYGGCIGESHGDNQFELVNNTKNMIANQSQKNVSGSNAIILDKGILKPKVIDSVSGIAQDLFIFPK